MSEAGDFQCARCGRSDVEPLGQPPFRDETGQRVAREICPGCWEDWKDRQMLLINHYGLNVREPEAREFLLENLRAFLFGEGEGAEIDTSLEGGIDW